MAGRVREAGQAPLRDGPRDATSGHLHRRGRLTHERAREGDSEASRRLKTEFLVQMDEVRRDDSEAGILVIGATNIPWAIDLSIKRRFERRIYIPLPNEEARERMFKLHVGDTPSNLTAADYRLLAQKTDGYSGADIVQDALMQPIHTFIAATHFKLVGTPISENERQWTAYPVTDPDAVQKSWSELARRPEEVHDPVITIADFEEALKNVHPSVTGKDIEGHMRWTQELGACCRELGLLAMLMRA